MSQGVRSAVTDATESALARRRTRKPRQSLQNHAHFTGNLVAFRESQRRAAIASSVASTAQNSSAAAPAQDVSAHADPAQTAEEPAARSATTSAAQVSDHKVPASNDSLIARDITTARLGLRSKVAMAVLAGLATGAVVGSLYFSGPTPEQAITNQEFPQSQATDTQATDTQATNTQAVDSRAIASPEIIDGVPQEPQIPLLPKSIPIVPVTDPVADELLAQREQSTEYLEEIDWLHTQNEALQREVESLDSETTELNAELLELELAVAAREAKAKPKIETRTVYNFVNVPLGGSVEQTDYQPSESVDNYSGENVDYNNEEYYREENVNYDNEEYYGEEDYREEESYQDNYYDADEDDLTEQFIDYHSGNDDQTQDQANSDSGTGQLIYDPESGYYINPLYVEPEEDERTGPSGRTTEFPPVLYPDEQ